MIGHYVTINKSDYSQATGKVISVQDQKKFRSILQRELPVKQMFGSQYKMKRASSIPELYL
jgi:hypothetical protein